LTKNPLPYDPAILPRELKRHYISATDDDIAEMLKLLGYDKLDQLFDHIPSDLLFSEALPIPDELAYEALQERMDSLASKNKICESFIGDGLPDFEVHEIISYIASIRNLTTAYTPYQPERSQGTLMSHWIYQCMMAMLTGFEAINSRFTIDPQPSTKRFVQRYG
jgi:glycine dehydrogenase